METAHQFVDRVTELWGSGAVSTSVFKLKRGSGVLERYLSGGQYRRILEIGTYRGLSAAFMSQFCDRVITVDLQYGQLERAQQSWNRAEFWRSLNVHNVDLILLADDAGKKDLIKRLDFDLAFIDAKKSDIISDFNLVKRCGAVLIHDYADREAAQQSHIFNFVNSLPPYEVEITDVFAFWKSYSHQIVGA